MPELEAIISNVYTLPGESPDTYAVLPEIVDDTNTGVPDPFNNE